MPTPNLKRRQLLLAAPGCALAGVAWAAPREITRLIRVGLTPAFLHDQHSTLDDWRRYMERKLRRPVEFIRRDRYREAMDLLRLGQLDFAWLCDYPFLHLRNLVRLLAVPLYRGRPYYRSYVVVSTKRPQYRSLADLKGGIFAYADPYSNSGYLSPRYQIRQMGENPATYFRKTFFTWSHRKVVEAVASGLAHGGAVDSFVWDTLAIVEPRLTAKTRIVGQSDEYGFPPLVAHRAVGAGDFAAVQRMLLDMGSDPEGAQLLRRLNLDGFIKGKLALYAGVARMMRAFGEY